MEKFWSILNFPKKIKFLSDDNEAELVKKILLTKNTSAIYCYTKSETKKGMEVTMTIQEIEQLISCKLLDIIS